MLITLPYPQRRDEIIRFVKRHHYSRRCPGVWTVAYAITNPDDTIQAVAMYGPPPYPSIARAFCKDYTHAPKLAWQSRLVGAGISIAQLDELLAYANAGLKARGYWWVYTLTDPVAKVIEDAKVRLLQKAFDGNVYDRNGWLYLGTTTSRAFELFLVDGEPVHPRQGKVTLTLETVQQRYPGAEIRRIGGNSKQRWVAPLGDDIRQYHERIGLMKYKVLAYENITQPRLLTKLSHPHRVMVVSAPAVIDRIVELAESVLSDVLCVERRHHTTAVVAHTGERDDGDVVDALFAIGNMAEAMPG